MNPRRPPARVLIVEDEPLLRASMARGIARLPEVEVVEAGSVAEALQRIEDGAPQLLLSDIDLPDRSGIEILGELGRRGLRVPVVFISAYLKAYGAQIPRHAGVEVREKPLALDELRELVSSRLRERAAASEDDGVPFSAADYLQIAAIGRHSVTIEVDNPTAGPGRIVIVRGEVWSAHDQQGSGEAAFRRLLFPAGASVHCRTLFDAPGERNVHATWEAMLLDAAREADEAGRDSGQPAGAAAVPSGAERAFDAAWDAALEALLAKDYKTALRAFLEAQALRPQDATVAANVKRLRELGIEPAP